MGGSQVDRVRIDSRGVHADRLWAVRDLQNDITASARRIPALLGCSARYAAEPGPDTGPGNVPEVIITFPGGDEVSSDDPRIHHRLAELVDRDVRLTPLAPVDDTSLHRMSVNDSLANFSPAMVRQDFGLGDAEELPDTSVFSTRQIITLARYSTPPGTFVDLSPVHVLSTASLRDLAAGGAPYDVRRFRPNVLVDVDEPDREFPESAWVGGDVTVGKVVLRVTNPTIRCVVPTRPQPELDLNRALTRQLAERTNRFLGIYADVATPGVVRVGDTVSVRVVSPPNAAQRAASAATKVATRGVQRLLEATVLRGRT
jgi:uncharacterized protein YcbX